MIFWTAVGFFGALVLIQFYPDAAKIGVWLVAKAKEFYAKARP